MTNRPTPNPLTYATHDTQWTLPSWIRTGLLVGVWLTLTELAIPHIGSLVVSAGSAWSVDKLWRLAQQPQLYWALAQELLLLPAWTIATLALVTRGRAAAMNRLAGWACLIIALLPPGLSAGSNVLSLLSVTDLESVRYFVESIWSALTSRIPLAVAGAILLMRGPRVRVDAHAGRRVRLIAGVAALLLHVPSVVHFTIALDARPTVAEHNVTDWPVAIALLSTIGILSVVGMSGAIVHSWVSDRKLWTLAAVLLMLATLSAVLSEIAQLFETVTARSGLDPLSVMKINREYLVHLLLRPLRDFPLAFALFAAGRLMPRGGSSTDGDAPAGLATSNPPPSEPN